MEEFGVEMDGSQIQEKSRSSHHSDEQLSRDLMQLGVSHQEAPIKRYDKPSLVNKPHIMDGRDDEVTDSMESSATSICENIDIGVQAIPEYSAHTISTSTCEMKSSGMCHNEGGWPPEIDPTDGEAVARWRKKVERNEQYVSTLLRLGATVDNIVKQNNAIEIYEDFFSGSYIPNYKSPGLETVALLKYEGHDEASTTCVKWLGESTCLVATEALAKDTNGCHLTLAYDIEFAWSPKSIFYSSNPLLCLAQNLSDPNTVAVGQENGQVGIFDLRNSREKVSFLSDRSASHNGPVKGVAWVDSDSNSQFMTTGHGEIVWWDPRNLSNRVSSIMLSNKVDRGVDRPCGPTILEYSHIAGSKYFVGTSCGDVLLGDLKDTTMLSSFKGHRSEVLSLSVNPFLQGYFLSNDKSSIKIWSRDVSDSLITIPCKGSNLTACTWSSSCCSCLYSINRAGSFEAWDILFNRSEPILSIDLLNGGCVSMDVHNTTGCISIGSDNGSTLIAKPNHTLRESNGSEIFERFLSYEASSLRT